MKGPNFRLQSFYKDGGKSEPQVYRIDEMRDDFKLGRRGFMATTAVAAGSLMLSRCTVAPARKKAAPAKKRENCTPGFRAHNGFVYALSFSEDGTRLASGGEDPTVKIWEMLSGTLLHSLKGHKSRINHVVFDPEFIKRHSIVPFFVLISRVYAVIILRIISTHVARYARQ